MIFPATDKKIISQVFSFELAPVPVPYAERRFLEKRDRNNAYIGFVIKNNKIFNITFFVFSFLKF